VVRVLSQVAQDTVYTFALLLGAYLLGTASGAAFYQRLLAGRYDPTRLRSVLLGALAVACLLGTLSLWPSESVQAWVVRALGDSFSAALAAEATIALAAFALPTFAMGALFSHLCIEVKSGGRGFGAAIGINTLGAALAPLLFGVLLVPRFGPKAVLLAIVFAYLLLVPVAHWKRARIWIPALAAAAVAFFGTALIFIDQPEGDPDARVVSYRDGVMATVSVVEDGNGIARLRINNRQQEGSSASVPSDARQAYLPLLLHPAPTDVLFLGLDTGVTAASAAEDHTLKVDAVELLPEVIAAVPYFAAALAAPPGTPGPHVMAGDAGRCRRHKHTRLEPAPCFVLGSTQPIHRGRHVGASQPGPARGADSGASPVVGDRSQQPRLSASLRSAGEPCPGAGSRRSTGRALVTDRPRHRQPGASASCCAVAAS